MATIQEQAAGAGAPSVRQVKGSAKGQTSAVRWLVAGGCLVGLSAYHWLIYAPHENVPHVLTILDRLFDVAVVGAILLNALLLGLRVLALIRVRALFTRLERVTLATGLGLGLISLGVLVLGMLHLYYAATFALALVALPWLLPAERRWVAQIAVGLRDRTPQLRLRWVRWSALQPETIARRLLAGISLSILGLMFFRDLCPIPILAYDTFQYHWAVPALLLRSHSMRAFPGWVHADLPFNSEMLDLVALALQAPVAATLIQDTFIALTALLIFALIRRYFGTTVAWLAVAAQLTVPLLIAYSSLAYVETALIFFGFAALVVLIRWLETLGRPEPVRLGLLLLAGLFLGLDIGVKYTAVEYVPGVAVVAAAGWVVFAWRQRARMPWPALLRTGVKAGAVLVGGIVLAFGPWALKNWLLLGDPMYPSLGGIFPTPLWNAARTQTLESTFRSFGPTAGKTAIFHLFALDLFFHPQRYGEFISFSLGSIGFGALLAAPFFGLALRRGWRHAPHRQRGQWLVVAVLSLSALLGFAVWTFGGALVERYALPSVILITVVGATLFGWLYRCMRRRFAVASWLLLFALITICGQQGWMAFFGGGPPGVPDAYHDYAYWSPLPVLTGQVSDATLSRERLTTVGVLPAPYLRMVDYVNQDLPHNGKLLMLGSGTGYFFDDREYIADTAGDWIPYLVSAGKTPRGMLGLLRAQGFTYVVYDARLVGILVRGYHNHVLQSYLPAYLAFQQCTLDYLGTWGYVSVYRVPGASPAPAAGFPAGALTSPMHRCSDAGASRSP